MTASSSRAVAALIGLTAVVAGWLALAYGRMSDWQDQVGAEPGDAVAGFVDIFPAMRWATATAVVVLLVVALVLLRDRRLVAAGLAALLAVALVAAFVVTPVPIDGSGFSAVVSEDDPSLDTGFLAAAALTAGTAVVSLVMALAAWRTRPPTD